MADERMTDEAMADEPLAGMSDDPHEMYRTLRAVGPVVRIDGTGVLITSHQAVEHVLHHPEVFSSSVDAADLKNERPLIPLQLDPPDHRRYRMLLNPLFAVSRMNAMEGAIARLAHELIDGFVGAEEIDFTSRFSIPLPSQVTLDLLGLPQEDLPRFLAMKDGIIHPADQTGKPLAHPDTQAHQAAAARSIYDYFDQALAQRRRSPGEDMLSLLPRHRGGGRAPEPR